ncbi:MAG: lamin tail domain-containing protein [Verrucomicrobiota bacterium]
MKSSERRTPPIRFVSTLAVLLLAGFHHGARAQTPDVVINEIDYAAGDAGNPAEFIELYNNSTNNVDLSGWKFDAGIDFTFPAATTLAAHGYLVVSGNPAAFATRWGFSPLGPWTGKLNNDGEQVRLRDAGGNTVDSVTYGAGFPWPTAARGGTASMELIHPGLDNDLGGSWRSSGQAAGGDEAQVYLPANDASWHYRKGTSEASSPVSAWRNIGFAEDSSWLVGQTSIGYGDNDDYTILTDMQNSYSSLFLRRIFNIGAGDVPAALKLRVRVDDGCIVWINGQEVARFHVDPSLVPAYNSFGQDHEAGLVTFEETNLPNAGSFLVEGSNIVAVQAFNATLGSSDLSIDVSLEEVRSISSTTPTPGAVNSCYSTGAPPAIRQVAAAPAQPAAGQPVTVTAKVTDPDGVASVSLKYQVVSPGAYIRKTDAAYTNNWTTVPMYDDGTHGDAVAGDTIYTSVIPGTAQVHRGLVRYRIAAADSLSDSIEVPYADDDCPNFAYFVYNGLPPWSGAFNPGVTPVMAYGTNVLGSLPVYQLIASGADVVSSQYDSGYNGQRFYGTLVYNGQVLDHVQFNNRGEYSTYVSGKNKWRFHFNTAHDLQPVDNWGRPYPETWNELNLNACASPWCAVHRGMAGVEEAVSLRLCELLGMASPKSHFLHFRVIDDASESGTTQYQGGDPSGVNGGDLWGLYLAVEQPDGSFLDARALPDGNVYKIESDLGDLKHQGYGQSTNGSDWTAYLSACQQTQSEAWWRTNLNLAAYYNFHAGNRILGNVDLRAGYNYYFYHSPDQLWEVIPWDLDMMFIAKSHNNEWIDQSHCIDVPALMIELQNRERELLDLVCSDAGTNGGQIGQLIDEYARLVAPAGTTTNWATLDAAMWNYNPRTSGDPNSHSGQTSHKGNFYYTPFTDSRWGGNWVRTLATSDFNGSMKYLLDYATDTFPGTSTWAVNNGDQRGYGYHYLLSESTDAGAPQRPSATYLGAPSHPVNDLRFSASTYAGANGFSAAQWRIGEISAPGIPLHDPSRPRVYEVTDVWRSAELTSNGIVTLPPASLQVGHTYRARVRHKDATGRWSRWSDAVQFVAAAAPATVTSSNLVVSEFMYNPPALSPAETNAGYSDKQLFEYVELLNISTNSLDLNGLAFTTGITFSFSPGTMLAPGERILVAKDTNAFALRYGAAGRVAGAYSGNLDNGGERVVLSFNGQTVQDFTYSDGSHPAGTDPWPAAPDGNGPSLVLMNPELAPDHNLYSNWRPGTATNGSPGRADLITYTEWSRRYPGLGASNGDDDQDGWSNQAEYAFGSSPASAAARPVPVSGTLESLSVASQTNLYLVFTCTRSSEAGDVDYFVEFSQDLAAWAPTGVLLDTTNNGNGTLTQRWRSAQPVAPAGLLFARLRAQVH